MHRYSLRLSVVVSGLFAGSLAIAAADTGRALVAPATFSLAHAQGMPGAGRPAPDSAAPIAKPAAPIAQPKPILPVRVAVPTKVTLASAQKRFKANDFEGALGEFKELYAAKETPETARYIGVCFDKLGKAREAVEFYDKFLAAPPKAMKSEVEEAKGRVEEIRAMGGHVHVSVVQPEATFVVDGKAERPQKAPADIDLAQGKHTFAFSAPGHDSTEKMVDVTFASAQTVTADLALTPPPPVPPPPPPPPVVAKVEPEKPKAPPPEPKSKLPAYVTGGIAVAALGLGAGFGIRALSKKSDFDKTPTEDLANSGENAALVADIAFGVALTFGITSVVLFLSDDDTDDDKAAASDAGFSAKPAVLPDGKTDTAPDAKPAPKTSSRAPRRVARPFIIPTPFITPHGAGAGALIRF